MKQYRWIGLLLVLTMLMGMIPAVGAQSLGMTEQEKLTIVSATASSQAAASLGPVNLIDGNTSNFWSSAVSKKADTVTSVDLTLSAASEVREIRMQPRVVNHAALCFPSGFVFQYSLNGSAWENIPGGTYTGYAASTDWQVFTLPETVRADRIRVYSTTCTPEGTNYYFQVAELEIYGETEVVEVPDSQVLSIIDYANSATPAANSFTAANLLDGDLSTFWSTSSSSSATPASPGYFDLVFPWVAGITEVQLMPRMLNGAPLCFPTAFRFQYSLGGSAWADGQHRLRFG